MLAALLAGCAGPAVAPPPQAALAGAHPARVTLDVWEKERFAEIASIDPRLARRVRITPSDTKTEKAVLESILAEEGVRVVGRQADVFSFDLRARELRRVAASAASAPAFDGPPSDAAREEVASLRRLLEEELARVDDERRLPRSASALVRAVVATWSAPEGTAALAERDAWLRARLEEIHASLQAEALRAVEVTELEDALDPLERLVEPASYPRAIAALTHLRLALGGAHAATGHGRGWEELRAGLAVHLGLEEPEATLRLELTTTEARLRREAQAELARLAEPVAQEARAWGVARWLAEDDCRGADVPGVRGVSPPPERAGVCAALADVARAQGDADSVGALLALHDAVALAAWALAVHVDSAEPDGASARPGLLGALPLEGTGRLARFVSVRPVACLAIGRMAVLLGDDRAARRERARRWRALGDVPLDVAARELGASR